MKPVRAQRRLHRQYGMSELRFERIRIIEWRLMPEGAGMALPGIGIVVRTGPSKFNNNLLRHEYGHILQARKTGVLLFYLIVGLPSLISAVFHGTCGHRHDRFWTEVWAEKLATDYFSKNH